MALVCHDAVHTLRCRPVLRQQFHEPTRGNQVRDNEVRVKVTPNPASNNSRSSTLLLTRHVPCICREVTPVSGHSAGPPSCEYAKQA
jgi:hypothetical protein